MSDTTPTTPSRLRKNKPRPPHILVDRSLGTKLHVGLTKFGYPATHLDTLMPRADNEPPVPDEDWIEYVGTHGWIALCVNPFMCKTPSQLDKIRETGARVFTLAHTQANADLKTFIFGVHWLRIIRRSQITEPCLWRVYMDGHVLKTI